MDIKHDVCTSCGAPIIFVVAAKSGKTNVLNRDPVANGNVAIIDNQAHFQSKANPLPDDADRYISHYATCPDAATFRANQKRQDDTSRHSWE
jgi:hypothetical protein